jgi:GTP:adenosylcobinamide-phosphate guanylyltransferase
MTIGRWTAIVLAGQRPGTDPLAAHFGGSVKALVPLAGEAMVTHVVRTLHATPEIAEVVVLAQDVTGLTDAVVAGGGARFAVSGKGISSSIKAVAGDTAAWPILVTTADHPLLTPAYLSHFLAGVGDADLAVGMVERAVVLARYPDNKRTWLKFRDGHWSGANVFALTSDRTLAALDLWAAAEQDRKQVWKLFLHFGPWLAIRALTRTIGLGDALIQAGRNLGMTAKLLPLPFAEAAIDVDKPADHAQAAAILAARGRAL